MRIRIERALGSSLLDRLSPEERAETLSLLLIELQRRIGIALMKILDEQSIRQFDFLMERGAESDEISAFFSVRIPDYRERIESIIDGFCDECVASLEAVSSVPL